MEKTLRKCSENLDTGPYLIQGGHSVKGNQGVNPQVPLRRARLWGGGREGNSHRPPLRDRAGNEGGELLRSLLYIYGLVRSLPGRLYTKKQFYGYKIKVIMPSKD